jgi:hypothetical protein
MRRALVKLRHASAELPPVQPPKTTLFGGGNEADVRKTLAHLGRRRLFPMD